MRRWLRAHLHIRSVRVCRRPAESRWTDAEYQILRSIGGNGITAKVDGTAVAVGNTKLMERCRYSLRWSATRSERSYMWRVDGAYAGHILISDRIKPHAKQAIENLKKAGVTRTVMLTGDRKQVRRYGGKRARY